MKAVFPRAAAALVLAASLAGCATGVGRGPPPTEVTRFHLGGEVARAQIAVEAFDQADANALEFRSYADAVARQLTRLGWSVVNTAGLSEQVALVNVEQGSREALRRAPVTIGVGAGTGGWHSGVGGGVSVPVGGGRTELVGTLLEVRIKRRSDGTVFWEGRATTEARAGSPEAQRSVAVAKLAQALFQDFPGESGRTIRVR
ncbi:MAG TPA: DUF4136 domain-containing protein [Allosphingosinicella sp.]|nr:DUF4136 domain-containing protein [Allosphingosinicella sp.]